MAHQEFIRMMAGSDTAVLMIHGIVGTPDHFRDLLPLIPENWSVHNLLLDGHGGSMEHFARSSMKKWKEQVKQSVSRLLEDHNRVLVIGHSMGTLFAIQEALDHPDRIPAVYLVGCPVRVRMPPSTVALCVRTSRGAKDPAAEAMRADCSIDLSPKPWKFLPWIPRFWELLLECRRIRRLLPQLRTPAFCYQSRRDELVSLRGCKELSQCPGLHLEILENSGHFSYSPEDTQRLKDGLQEVICTYF